MELSTTAQAAEHCGITVQHFHRLADRYGIEPETQLPGITGAKLWSTKAVEAVALAAKKVTR